MAIKLYTTPQRWDVPEDFTYSVEGEVLTIDGEQFDLSDVDGYEQLALPTPFVQEPVFRLGGDVHVRVIVPYGANDVPVDVTPGMPNPPAPPVPPAPGVPQLFASAGFSIAAGVLGGIEMAAQLQSAYYEDGWIMVGFGHPQDDTNYLVFVQTDVPAKIEQFKDLGSFELVFSDPATGDPIEPGRIDLQILKVR